MAIETGDHDSLTVTVKTSPGEYIVGRNGTTGIKAIAISKPGPTLAFIDGISRARGLSVNGGFCISLATMDQLATEWLKARSLYPCTEYSADPGKE